MVSILKAAKINFVMFDYEGYGLSKGKPSHMSIREDGLIIYDLISKNTNNIIVIGHSLGGFIATTIASQRDCKKLILLSTFSSLDDLSKNKIFYMVASAFVESITNTMSNKNIITKVKCPVLIIHSVNDTVVPFSCAVNIYNNCKTEKTIAVIDGDHSKPVLNKYALSILLDFLEVNNKYELIKTIFKINQLYN